MIIIRSPSDLARILNSSIDIDLKRILRLRGGTGSADFYIIGPDDPVPSIELTIGFPILTDLDGNRFDHPDFASCFEWIVNHRNWYEACLQLSDDGPATVMLVPENNGADPQLLALCHAHCLPTG